MECAKELKAQVARGEVTTGVVCTDPVSTNIVEYCLLAGLDYLIVDREHGVHSDEQLATICDIGRMLSFPILLRPVDTEYATLRHAIDKGPCGLLLPSVESAEELDRVAESIWMPPRGKRRPGGAGNYWVPDFSLESWQQGVEEHFIVLPMIETQLGLDNAAAIAAHAVTTAIAIGPYDLSHSLGYSEEMLGALAGEGRGPSEAAAVAQIKAAGEACGNHVADWGRGAAGA